MSVDAYLRQVLETGGSILQLNTIGPHTMVTAYRNLGVFECYLWDNRDPETRDVGDLLEAPQTMESASGIHYAFSQALWRSPAGGETRKRAKGFQVDISNL